MPMTPMAKAAKDLGYLVYGYSQGDPEYNYKDIGPWGDVRNGYCAALGFLTPWLLDRWSEGGALEIDVLERSDERLDFNVTRCRYAEMYHRLGLGDLGGQLSCCRDAALAAGYDPGIELSRTQTIMQGAPYCDFRFRKRPDVAPGE